MPTKVQWTVIASALAVAVTLPIAAQQPPPNPYPPVKPERMAAAGTAARGAQLVMLGGCHDCHTPKLQNGAIDFSKSFMGHPANAPLAPEVVGGASTNMLLTAWRGPWGLTLARNLTPDKETGIGTWTLADFKKTIRTGVNPRGEVLRPPMPIPNLQRLPDADLEAIYLYLRTVTPIRNPVGRTDVTKGDGSKR
ncbi:MAG: diheme cytochrome c-553 [Acidobacteria bacterium]|nr:diheme cytochrome c-553 [Acidobacteriota bacterium]